MLGVRELELERCLLGLKLGAFALVFLLRDLVSEAHVHEPVQPRQRVSVRLLLAPEHGAAGLRFLAVGFLEAGHCPVPEPIRDGDAVQEARELLLKLLLGQVRLGARFALLGAVVVHVALAARFDVHLAGDGSVALGAGHQPGVAQGVALGLVAVLAAEDLLDPAKLILGDHGLVAADKGPDLAFHAALDEAVVEGVAEHLVQAARVQLASTEASEDPGAVGPSLVRRTDDSRDRVRACEHQVPHLADQGEAVRVRPDGVVDHVVEVPLWGQARVPATLQLRAVAALDVLGEVVNVLLRHPELYVHQDGVVLGGAVGLRRRLNAQAVLFERPDHASAVNRVAGEPVQLPAQDTLDLTA